MIRLVIRNLLRRPWRNALTMAGVAVAVAVFVCLTSFGDGYRRVLGNELERAGLQMMVVPLGCPYDAAARVLKSRTLETSLPEAALAAVRRDPAVAVAAPMLIAALPRENNRRTDMWVGLDRAALELKPWWRMKAGQPWFASSNSLIVGADAAAVEMRAPGDTLFSPETEHEFQVTGILERSGTSDDSVFFVALETAQEMFSQQGRLTAIAIRLKDPAEMSAVAQRLQKIPGAQVVTMTEMMGTFLNLVGAVRTLVTAIAAIALAVSGFTVFNTLLAGVLERSRELAIIRAIGGSRAQVFALLTAESLALTVLGSAGGTGLALLAGPLVETIVKKLVPFAPVERLLTLNAHALLQAALVAIGLSAVAALYPAWRATQLQPALATKLE